MTRRRPVLAAVLVAMALGACSPQDRAPAIPSSRLVCHCKLNAGQDARPSAAGALPGL